MFQVTEEKLKWIRYPQEQSTNYYLGPRVYTCDQQKQFLKYRVYRLLDSFSLVVVFDEFEAEHVYDKYEMQTWHNSFSWSPSNLQSPQKYKVLTTI